MASIKEFSGYRFDQSKFENISDIMAVAYDRMTEEEREKFSKKSLYNIVRVSNNRIDDEEKGYIDAEKNLEKWVRDGILKKEKKPGMYLYEQHSIYKGTTFINRGIVCLLKLQDLDANSSVKICEETNEDSIEDRFKLTSKIKANVDMINGMYIDSERPLTHLINEISEEKPDMEFDMPETITGELTNNRLWVIDDSKRIEFIKESLKDINVFITDGHNRYMAALKYRNECIKNNPNHTGEEPYNYIMAFLSNSYGDNMVQLPIHRLITNKRFSEDYFIACSQDHFKVEKIIVDTSNDELTETMKKQIETSRRKCIIGVYFGGNYFYRLTLTDYDYIKSISPEHSEEYKMLDVNILNDLLLGELLGITKENYEEYVTYTKRTTKGVKWVNEEKASCLFVMNTTKAERICEVVNSGETMPEASIYIFPNVVTGIVINKISENE